MTYKSHPFSQLSGERIDSEHLLLGFADYRHQGLRLAAELEIPVAEVGVHRFPDGESRVRVPLADAPSASPGGRVPPHAIFCRSLDRPNDKLVELLLAARTAREYGAERLTLVAPYLCYMRQDMAFEPGEAVSQRILGGLLAEVFDDVITVDPHLHRVSNIEEAVPARRALALSSAQPMGEFLAKRLTDPLLIGPDAESAQWVAALAEPGHLDHAVASKERLGDQDVRVQLPDCDVAGRTVVLVDDMISTGHTAAGAAAQLKDRGATDVYCLVAHALFAAEAPQVLAKAGVSQVWSSDSVDHASNAVHLAGLLAAAVRSLLHA